MYQISSNRLISICRPDISGYKKLTNIICIAVWLIIECLNDNVFNQILFYKVGCYNVALHTSREK